MAQRKKTSRPYAPSTKPANTAASLPVAQPIAPATTAPQTWKDHPIAVAALSVAGTIALAVLVVKEVILPTQMAALGNQIIALNNEVKNLSNEAATLKTANTEGVQGAAQLKQQIVSLEQKLFEAQMGNLFSPSSPYPMGLSQVKIGELITRVAETYPEKSIKTNEDTHWTVEGQHKIFNHITYYINTRSPKKEITHILFLADSDRFKGDELHHKLIEAFGPPKVWKRKSFFSWTTPSKHQIYKRDSNYYVVMSNGDTPGHWPDN